MAFVRLSFIGSSDSPPQGPPQYIVSDTVAELPTGLPIGTLCFVIAGAGTMRKFGASGWANIGASPPAITWFRRSTLNMLIPTLS